MVYDRPAPLVGVDLMAEVRGRLDAGGEEAEPLDEESVAAALRRLVDKGVEAITVCLLNSYANPAHEQAVARVAEAIGATSPSSSSSDVLAEFREYERAVTTTMNAYVAPGDGALPERPAAAGWTPCARAPSCRSCAPTAG